MPVGVGDVPDEFDIVYLTRAVECDYTRGAANFPSVGKQRFGRVFLFQAPGRVMHRGRVHLKKIDHYPPTGGQMLANGAQAGELVFNLEQVLEAAERNGDESKLAAEIKSRHAGAHQLDTVANFRWLVCQLLPAARQHARGKIEAGDLDPGTGCGDEDPAGAAAQLQHRPACGTRLGDVEIHIRTIGVDGNVIVKV